ncbi:hypothetical protein GCM10023264_09660 [Sphingomonas daechungensis]|uniref:Glycosyltransferase n=1 Tax=Sphingomonas daechungensis TaxID=1176646 RepID=A0ABX6T2W4_9SPHN|nr:glycosyltransferase [Sphingomonas daechungensis]QNP43242.1 glycosyltransferase [Sphingomonas daechungensis]
MNKAAVSDDWTLSVVLGRVSTEDGDRVLETIAALDEKESGAPVEIVIADRLQDGISDRIRKEHPHVRLVPCPSDMTLPEMRLQAFDQTSGSIVAVTEDHCVPSPGWAGRVREAFAKGDDDLVAVGGSVVNGVCDRGLDWATFICEYSFFSPPVVEGMTDALPGMNVAYRRSVLEEADRERLRSGFWETTLHPGLVADGPTFYSSNQLAMFHKKKFSWRLFMAQRFIYSRYYAGLRFQNAGMAKRLAAGVASLALPPILFYRMTRAIAKKGLQREFIRALPSLSTFIIIWAIGESYGAIFGPGDALARIE